MRPGRSVIATATAKGAPISIASTAPKKAVSSVCHVARNADGVARRLEEGGEIDLAAGRQGREQQPRHRQQAEQEDNGKDG